MSPKLHLLNSSLRTREDELQLEYQEFWNTHLARVHFGEELSHETTNVFKVFTAKDELDEISRFNTEKSEELVLLKQTMKALCNSLEPMEFSFETSFDPKTHNRIRILVEHLKQQLI